jgi:glycosyltransferase involved in cell wall biosynthesis
MPSHTAHSVIVPCYNAARFIGATLRSVLAQQGVELDVIVVDDGSSDGSAALVEQDFPQVRVIRQANRGVAAARNAGLAVARHDWVAFVDADDLWLPGKLQAQWQALQAEPEAGMAYTAWQVWTSREPEPAADWLAELDAVAADTSRWQGATGWIYPELLVDCEVWSSTVLVRRDLVLEAGGFDPDLRVCEDWDLWLRLSRLTPVIRVSQPLALYRQHPLGITRSPMQVDYKRLVIGRALERWGLVGPDGRSARLSDIRASLARTARDRAGAWFLSGRPKRLRWSVVARQVMALYQAG